MKYHTIRNTEKPCVLQTLFSCREKKHEAKVLPINQTNLKPKAILHVKERTDISIHYYDSLSQIPSDWDKISNTSNQFLDRSFLEVFEKSRPRGLHPRYLLFLRRGKAIGIAYFQIINFQPDQHIQTLLAEEGTNTKSLTDRFKAWFSRQFDYQMLICGNNLLTGEHGFVFLEEEIKLEERTQLLEKATWELAKHLRQEGQSIDVLFQKDVHASNLSQYQSWFKHGFHSITFQPNMLLHLRPEWKNFEDYLGAMSSKYRVRAKRAAKKSQMLKRKWLTQEEVAMLSGKMYSLYLNVAKSAEFNMITLPPDYFLLLKKQLGKRFEILAYFREEELVGFCTLLHQNGHSEAHFLGLSPEANPAYQLYLNMLYDLIEASILKRKVSIHFGRTAMEIKSSVGAIPETAYCLIRSYHGLPNHLLPYLVNWLEPKVSWQQRHPFREEG